MSTRLSLACLLLVVGSVLGTGGCSEPRGTRVVLVTIDTLRADGLSAEHMPRTHGLAERGLSFERFYASTSTTQPTHASLFTGLHPWQHGVTRNGIVLGEEFDTVAEAFRRAGFTTHAVASSFPMHADFGFGQGFDTYADRFEEPYVSVWEGRELEEGRFYSLADAVTESALAALDAAEGRRQFFWFHYFDPHDPYGDTREQEGEVRDDVIPIGALLGRARRGAPDAADLAVRARALYDRDVRAMDSALGRLFDRLEAEEGEFETHLLLTSDHGESFGELGCLGHGKRLTPEQVHVPLVLVSPRLAPGVRSEPAGSVDVPATLLSLAGLGTAGFPGRDLGEPADGGRASAFGMRRSFAEPRTELLLDGTEYEVHGPRFFGVLEEELLTGDREGVFVGDDPDRPVDGPESERMRAAFAAFEHLLEGTQAEELLDPEIQDALRKLGYVR